MNPEVVLRILRLKRVTERITKQHRWSEYKEGGLWRISPTWSKKRKVLFSLYEDCLWPRSKKKEGGKRKTTLTSEETTTRVYDSLGNEEKSITLHIHREPTGFLSSFCVCPLFFYSQSWPSTTESKVGRHVIGEKELYVNNSL